MPKKNITLEEFNSLGNYRVRIPADAKCQSHSIISGLEVSGGAELLPKMGDGFPLYLLACRESCRPS